MKGRASDVGRPPVSAGGRRSADFIVTLVVIAGCCMHATLSQNHQLQMLHHEQVVEEYACFNTIFDIVCPSEGDIVIFETARYGRNDTLVAALCEIPFTRNCDIDVHFLLNRACAGRRKCSIAVNTAFFGDPCGYEEFLKVTYRCVPATMIQSRCSETEAVALYNTGYITSPNYPNKYYMDAECRWIIHVQRRQTIRITLFDFELDVKRGGRCYDHLEISSGDKMFFRDCGALGRQIVDIDTSCNHLLVVFRTGQTSLTQRGFLLYYEAVGHGCPTLPDAEHRLVSYFIDADTFYANVSCDDGFYLDDGSRPNAGKLIECVDFFWNGRIPLCVVAAVVQLPTPPYVYTGRGPPTAQGDRVKSSLDRSAAPLVGVTLGIVLAILAITLILLTAMYCCHRRWQHRSVHRKQRQWSMVVNGLHDDVIGDRDVYCTSGMDPGKKTWRQQQQQQQLQRCIVNGNSSGNSTLGGGRVPSNELCDVTGHRTYLTADDEWTCRRLLIPSGATHTCGSGSGDDDDTMATLMDRYSTVTNNSTSNIIDYGAYCPVCSPACDARQYGLYTSCQQTVNGSAGTATVSNSATVFSTFDTAVVRAVAAGRPAADASSYATASRPDLLRPISAATTNKSVAVVSAHASTTAWSPQRSCSATSRRSLLSCSAPDLIELTRLQETTVGDRGNDDNTSDDESDAANGRYCRSRFATASLPQRHARHASVVWCDRKSMASPYGGGARHGRRTNMAATKNDSHLITGYRAPENFCS